MGQILQTEEMKSKIWIRLVTPPKFLIMMWLCVSFILDGQVPDNNPAFINFLTNLETYLTMAMSLFGTGE